MTTLRWIGIVWLLLLGVARGQSGRPWLGLELGPGKRGGAAITAVFEDSPAAQAKLAVGEEVVEIDGRKLRSPEDLINLMLGLRVGARLPLKVLGPRGARTVELVLGPRPSSEELQRRTLLGKMAPDFKPEVVVGAKLGNLSSLRGRVVLLDFFATWCAPCRAAMPHLAELDRRFRDKGLQIIGISNEEPSVVSGAAGRFHLAYPLVVDRASRIASRYLIYSLPTAVLLDRRGVVQHLSIADVHSVERAVAELLEKP